MSRRRGRRDDPNLPPPPAIVELDVLGPVRLRVDGVEIPSTPHRRDVLALLAASEHPVHRHEICALVSLKDGTLRRMLRDIGDDFGLHQPFHRSAPPRSGCIEIDAALVTVDVHRFRREFAEAEEHAAAGDRVTAARTAARALARWRGDPLSNTTIATTEKGQALVAALRARRSRLEGLARLADTGPARAVGANRDRGTSTEPPSSAVAVAAVCSDPDGTLDPHLFAAVAGVPTDVAPPPGTSRVGEWFCFDDLVQRDDLLDAIDNTDRRRIHHHAADAYAKRTATDADPTTDPQARARWRRHAVASGDRVDRIVAMAGHIAAADHAEAGDDLHTARELLAEAIELVTDPREEADLRARRAALGRRVGCWDDAAADLRVAADVAELTGDAERAAQLTLALADLTWDPAIGGEVDQRLRRIRPLLMGRHQLVARIDLCLAGGTFQDGRSGDVRLTPHRLNAAVARIEGIVDRHDRAQALIHARKALFDHIPPQESLILAQQIGWTASDSVDARAHSHLATFVDLLRLDRRIEAGAVLRTWERDWPEGRAASMDFSIGAARICRLLAFGRFSRAQELLVRQTELAATLGGLTVQQVVVGQRFWLARHTGDRAELESLAALAAYGADHLDIPLWGVVAASIAVQLGDRETVDRRLGPLLACCRPGELPRGPHRLPTLALLSELLVDALLHGSSVPASHRSAAAAELQAQLAGEPQRGVLAGWPAVFLGPTSYALGLAAAAAGDHAAARTAILDADRRNRWTPPLLALTAGARRLLDGG